MELNLLSLVHAGMLNPPLGQIDTWACLYKRMPNPTWTNILNQYRITGYLFDGRKDPFSALHVSVFYCMCIKESTYQLTDNRQSALLTQFIRPGEQKGLTNKGFCRQTCSSVEDNCRQKLGEPPGKTNLENKESVAFERSWPRLVAPLTVRGVCN